MITEILYPVSQFNELTKRAARNAGQGFAESVRKEFNEAIDRLFDEKLNQLADKLDYIAQQRIAQSQNAVKDVVTHTVNNFSDLKDELKGDIEYLIGDVNVKYKENIRLTFEEINQARVKAILGLREIIGDVDRSLESKITQVSITIMTALKNAEKISNNFTPGAFLNNLINPAFDRIDQLEKNVIQDLNAVLDKLTGILETTIDTAQKRLFGIFLQGLVKEPCRETIGMGGVVPIFVHSLTPMQLYRYIECRELEQIDICISNNSSVNIIRDSYIQLQINASMMHIRAKGLGIAELQIICTKDWVKYGQLSSFWSQFSG